jgi:serine/threonine-protein kinase
MQLDSAQDLIEALRVSGLFTPEQFAATLGELAPLAGSAAAIVKHLLTSERLTSYQLKKVLHGRAGELIVGPYVITDKLGSGGMGKVYRARDGADGPMVALKVVRPTLVQNPTVRGRYAREVQAARALNHPNIVGILGAGEANGRVYLAMEFVDGIDLARLMREFGAVAVEEACEYIRQAALGLQHAHDRGFVHRDVKPSNLVVAGERHLPQATEPAVVKLLDLGLARAIDPDDMVAPDLTRDHAVVGTPDYMAPEQAKSSRDVDPRADLYGLGCALYYLLTGRVPFPYPSAIEKILAHQTEPPPPVQALRPEVPTAVAGIVVRLMAKRPADRFQTADALAAALAPHARYPVGAPPIEVVLRRDPGRVGPPATSTERSPGPASRTASSGVPFSGLDLSVAEGPTSPPEPRVPPVAPSDHTPRPRGLAAPEPHPAPPTDSQSGAAPAPAPETAETGEPDVRPAPRRRTRRPPNEPDRASSRFVWGALALMVSAFFVILVWLLFRS